MPSPILNVRLHIPSYTPITLSPNGGAALEVVFRLKASRIQKNLTDGAMVIPNRFRGSPLSFSVVRYAITVNGVILDDQTHTDHPVTAYANTLVTEHLPDFIDLEEAAVVWNDSVNSSSLTSYPRLEIEHAGGTSLDAGFRSYVGVIMSLELIKRAARREVDFVLIFGVAWDSRTFPGIREWS